MVLLDNRLVLFPPNITATSVKIWELYLDYYPYSSHNSGKCCKPSSWTDEAVRTFFGFRHVRLLALDGPPNGETTIGGAWDLWLDYHSPGGMHVEKRAFANNNANLQLNPNERLFFDDMTSEESGNTYKYHGSARRSLSEIDSLGMLPFGPSTPRFIHLHPALATEVLEEFRRKGYDFKRRNCEMFAKATAYYVVFGRHGERAETSALQHAHIIVIMLCLYLAIWLGAFLSKRDKPRFFRQGKARYSQDVRIF